MCLETYRRQTRGKDISSTGVNKEDTPVSTRKTNNNTQVDHAIPKGLGGQQSRLEFIQDRRLECIRRVKDSVEKENLMIGDNLTLPLNLIDELDGGKLGHELYLDHKAGKPERKDLVPSHRSFNGMWKKVIKGSWQEIFESHSSEDQARLDELLPLLEKEFRTFYFEVHQVHTAENYGVINAKLNNKLSNNVDLLVLVGKSKAALSDLDLGPDHMHELVARRVHQHCGIWMNVHPEHLRKKLWLITDNEELNNRHALRELVAVLSRISHIPSYEARKSEYNREYNRERVRMWLQDSMPLLEAETVKLFERKYDYDLASAKNKPLEKTQRIRELEHKMGDLVTFCDDEISQKCKESPLGYKIFAEQYLNPNNIGKLVEQEAETVYRGQGRPRRSDYCHDGSIRRAASPAWH
jgi:hypothetical protein